MENEENKIQEGEIFEPEKVEDFTKFSEESKPKKKRNDFYIELVLFFILGILVGIAAKTEALKRITVGFDDYKMKIERQDYDINELEIKLSQEQAQDTQNEQAPENTNPDEENTNPPSNAG